MIELEMSNKRKRYFIVLHHVDKRVREVNRPIAFRICEFIRTMSILVWITLISFVTLFIPLLSLLLGNGSSLIDANANLSFVILFVGMPVVAMLCDKAMRGMTKGPSEEMEDWQCPDCLPEDF